MWTIEDGKQAIGHWVQGEQTGKVGPDCKQNSCPADNRELGIFAEATDALLEQTIAAAQEGFRYWSKCLPQERAALLRKLARLIETHKDSLAHWEALDTGRPIREILDYDLPSSIDCLNYNASLADTQCSRFLNHSYGHARVEHIPLGVCVGIGAWNYPLQVLIWKIAPALAAGNSMIIKPSELTPLTAMMFCSLASGAGAHPGLLQCLNGYGELGQKLVDHPGVAKVSLTGSVKTGIKVAAQASSHLKKVTMELGGKSPIIITEKADLTKAAHICMAANFYSSGQICSNGTRVFVPQKLETEFLQIMQPKINSIRAGHPLDPKTELGSMIHPEHCQKVHSKVQRAIEQGANLVCGGDFASPYFSDTPLNKHAYYQCTVLNQLKDEWDIVKEEVFGPVMALLTYTDLDEAIARANKTPYGLAAGVVSEDLLEGESIANQLEAGIVWINTYNDTPVQLPFGGQKLSGLGRENGYEGFQAYTQAKTTMIGKGPISSVFSE